MDRGHHKSKVNKFWKTITTDLVESENLHALLSCGIKQ